MLSPMQLFQSQRKESDLYAVEINRVNWGWDLVKTFSGFRVLTFQDSYNVRSTSNRTSDPDLFGNTLHPKKSTAISRSTPATPWWVPTLVVSYFTMSATVGQHLDLENLASSRTSTTLIPTLITGPSTSPAKATTSQYPPSPNLAFWLTIRSVPTCVSVPDTKVYSSETFPQRLTILEYHLGCSPVRRRTTPTMYSSTVLTLD